MYIMQSVGSKWYFVPYFWIFVLHISGDVDKSHLDQCFSVLATQAAWSLPFILSATASISSVFIVKPYTDDIKKKIILFIIVILCAAGKKLTDQYFGIDTYKYLGGGGGGVQSSSPTSPTPTHLFVRHII